MVTTLTSPTHVQNRITCLTKQSIFFAKDIFHIDKLAVQSKLYMIGLKAVWHRAVPLRPQTRETGGVLLHRTEQGPKLYQVEFDFFYYIKLSLLEACFDLISGSSLSMKIEIMGGKITENLGFKSLLQMIRSILGKEVKISRLY